MIPLKYFLFKCSPFSFHRECAKTFMAFRKAKTKILLITPNKTKVITPLKTKYMKKLHLKIASKGNCLDNVLKIEWPQNDLRIRIRMEYCKHSEIYFHKHCRGGEFAFILHAANNKVDIGNGVTCTSDFKALLTSHTLIIGEDSMIASGVRIWGDGHAVIEKNTNQVLNEPLTPIVIGKHCWLCACTYFTKNAQIPDDCVVGLSAVVTKKFDEKHAVIAGNPAKIVKTGISWDRDTPLDYKNKTQK